MSVARNDRNCVGNTGCSRISSMMDQSSVRIAQTLENT